MAKWKRRAEDRRRAHHRALAQRLGKQALNEPAKVAIYSLQEAVELSGYSEGYLLRLLREGSIVGAEKDHRWRIEQWSLHSWLAERAAAYKLRG